MALADIFKVTHFQEVLGEVFLNTYFYECDGGGSAVDLRSVWMTDFFPLVKAIQGGTLLNTHVRTESLGNLADWDDHTINEGAGYDTADTLPVFNAVGFTMRAALRSVKAGSKRYAMIPETVQIRGILSDSVYLTKCEALRVGLDTGLIGTGSEVYTPVLVKRIKYAVPDSDPVRYAYRLPEAGDTLVVSTFNSVFMSTTITHQVSRGN